MNFNKYNTRNSGRFNTPGQFVPASEGSYEGNMGPAQTLQTVQYNNPQTQPTPNKDQGFNTIKSPLPSPAPPPPPLSDPENIYNTVTDDPQPTDVDMKTELGVESDEATSRPPWMKAKLQGVKKISNKERRRRQNENLRRLLTPKSALMVLNEIVPGEQVAQQFRVEAVGAAPGTAFYRAVPGSFCADLTLKGNSYKGYGDNKLTARNAAAEQAVRDLILRRMTRALLSDGDGEAAETGEGGGTGSEEEPLPMIQLASFALHKLFAEWECDGHKVPQLRSPHASEDAEAVEEAASVAANPTAMAGGKRRQLPEHASAMHPCMLLTYMRPQLEYRELAAEGNRPQNMQFTMGIEVDGVTYTGKASNKKEARKAAARAACVTLFGVQFDSLH